MIQKDVLHIIRDKSYNTTTEVQNMIITALLYGI